MSKGKINLAAVARTNDISYQRLLKKVKAGIPLSTAIDECLIAREASISSGSRPHRSSRGRDLSLGVAQLMLHLPPPVKKLGSVFPPPMHSAAGLLQTNDYQ